MDATCRPACRRPLTENSSLPARDRPDLALLPVATTSRGGIAICRGEYGGVGAKFHVRSTFTLKSRNLFILAGSIVEGFVKPGMSVRIAFKPSFSLVLEINSIEFSRRPGGEEDVCLCIKCEEDRKLGFLNGLAIDDETVAIEWAPDEP